MESIPRSMLYFCLKKHSFEIWLLEAQELLFNINYLFENVMVFELSIVLRSAHRLDKIISFEALLLLIILLHISLTFRDTAGQERFRTITTAYYRGAMVRGMLTFPCISYSMNTSSNLSSFTYQFLGNHACLWYYQWQIFWEYQELDQKYWRG